ncbi:DUF1987 domain-containing protein [Thermomonas brevis]|uniref:DUF1987 domain-containing protein n=1 Tax=Thermomonas brevis TaxID=215691 RepID=A0A7G9QSZ1_9GAMM|nr:biofilm regulation phosphoprotein SiaC [Thermomonas brevis]QNN46466.1 DUF1987 domain-containing protein [Thermomonas brevis]
MNDIRIDPTQSSPAIHADTAAGVLRLSGDSYPENAFDLFGPVIDWVERYLAGGDAPLRLELRLLYLNTSSIRAMIDIFDLLETAHGEGRAVSVQWIYDQRNERVRELAEEFAEDCTFPFQILAGTDADSAP